MPPGWPKPWPGATIRVNTRLLAGQPSADAPAAPAAEKAEQAELDAARSQGQASDSLAKRVRMTLAEKQADAPIPDQKPVEPATESTPASTAPPPAVAEEVPAPLAPPVVEEPAVRTPPAPIGPAQPDPVGPPAQAGGPTPPAPAMAQQGHEAAAPASVPTPGPDASAAPAPAEPPGSAPAEPPARPADGPADGPPRTGPGEVIFTAVKASWILYTVDEGREERVYLKPGKPHRIAYARRLTVRLGHIAASA